MAASTSPPESSLSSMATSDAEPDREDVASHHTLQLNHSRHHAPRDTADDEDAFHLRPPKRIKISGSSAPTTPEHRDDVPLHSHQQQHHHHHHHHHHHQQTPAHHHPRILSHAPPSAMSDVSSDTSGDVPSSPSGSYSGLTGGGGVNTTPASYAANLPATATTGTRHDDDDFPEQVTVCEWDGCDAGDLGDLDELVRHIHEAHIENKVKRYTCEWLDCPRKSATHASGYALKAHLRKHTREKPFYCYLPECDRSFTRSDALAKHMRTVHEADYLRPSDPVPKALQSATLYAPLPNTASNSGAVAPRLKIIIKQPHHDTGASASIADDASSGGSRSPLSALAPEHGFSEEELAQPLPRLFRQCRRELAHAEKEARELLAERTRCESAYEQLWREKEALLAQTVGEEVAWHESRRTAEAAALADVKSSIEARDG